MDRRENHDGVSLGAQMKTGQARGPFGAESWLGDEERRRAPLRSGAAHQPPRAETSAESRDGFSLRPAFVELSLAAASLGALPVGASGP